MATPALSRLHQLFRRIAQIEAATPNPTPEIDYVSFTDQTASPPYQEGRCWYADNVLNLYTEFPDVTIQNGEELQVPVVNKEGGGVTILNGQPCCLKGPQGHRVSVGLAVNSNLAFQNIIGLATHNIADNQNGRVTAFGLVRDIDTSMWSVPAPLYIDGLGVLTQTRPTEAGLFACRVAVVLSSHPTQGILKVSIFNEGVIANTTVLRPLAPRVGQMFFDTTLGRPIWWSGSQWILSEGSAV